MHPCFSSFAPAFFPLLSIQCLGVSSLGLFLPYSNFGQDGPHITFSLGIQLVIPNLLPRQLSLCILETLNAFDSPNINTPCICHGQVCRDSGSRLLARSPLQPPWTWVPHHSSVSRLQVHPCHTTHAGSTCASETTFFRSPASQSACAQVSQNTNDGLCSCILHATLNPIQGSFSVPEGPSAVLTSLPTLPSTEPQLPRHY